MSNGQRMDVTNMMWQPELMRLHALHPEIDGGNPSAVYITPQSITTVRRAVVVFGSATDKDKRFPPQELTEVFFCHGALHVIESPEEVARLRDVALGHEPPKPPLKRVP